MWWRGSVGELWRVLLQIRELSFLSGGKGRRGRVMLCKRNYLEVPALMIVVVNSWSDVRTRLEKMVRKVVTAMDSRR